MNILFVCKHNRFRSKVAEALFKKYNTGKNEVRSAGALIDHLYRYPSKAVIEAVRGKGGIINEEKSRQLDDHLINWADKIILVADNVSRDAFPKKKVVVWKVSDCSQNDEEAIRRRIEIIDNKVKKLIKESNKIMD